MKIFKILAVGAMLMFGAVTANAQNFGGPQMDPEEMVKMRADQLKESANLTDAQYTKVLELYREQTKEFQKIFEGGGEPDFSAFGKIMQKEEDGLKEILDEKQFKAWQEERQQQMANFGGGF